MVRKIVKDKSFYYSDPMYSNYYIAKLVNFVMKWGKKQTARKIVYNALDIASKELKAKPDEIITNVLANVAPSVEVRAKRVGGAVYQVPFEVSPERQITLCYRWIVDLARSRKGLPMAKKLAKELIDGFNNIGEAVKKKESVHKTAAANRAFAHFARY